MGTVLIAQFCNNSFKGAGKNFQVRCHMVRLPDLGHAICWSNGSGNYPVVIALHKVWTKPGVQKIVWVLVMLVI